MLVLSQTCVFQGGFDKKHQLSIVPKLDYFIIHSSGPSTHNALAG